MTPLQSRIAEIRERLKFNGPDVPLTYPARLAIATTDIAFLTAALELCVESLEQYSAVSVYKSDGDTYVAGDCLDAVAKLAEGEQ